MDIRPSVLEPGVDIELVTVSMLVIEIILLCTGEYKILNYCK